jgi:hypothetical protein
VTPEELVELGHDVVQRAKAIGAEVRVMGGAATYARCPSIETHPKLQRAYDVLDLVAADTAWGVVTDLLASLGFAAKHNAHPHATLERGDTRVDLRGTNWRDYYSFDLAPRLALDETTLPLADLLLLKLQRFRFTEKDIQDAAALLLDHRVGTGGDKDTIDRAYIYRLTNRNWGLWTTVFDNTVTMEKNLDRYLDPEEAQLVWRRIELIQEVMDGKGKSITWWLRAIPNRHVKWYRESPE